MTESGILKKRVHISIRGDLLEASREFKIDLSREAEKCIVNAVQRHRVERSLSDNCKPRGASESDTP